MSTGWCRTRPTPRIIDGIGRKLGLPAERVVVTVDRHANTSAASIPLALAEAYADGRIRRGQLVLMEALGGGLTWGSALVRLWAAATRAANWPFSPRIKHLLSEPLLTSCQWLSSVWV